MGGNYKLDQINCKIHFVIIFWQSYIYFFKSVCEFKSDFKNSLPTFCKSTYSDESKQIKSCEYIQGTFFMHTKQFRDLCIR